MYTCMHVYMYAVARTFVTIVPIRLCDSEGAGWGWGGGVRKEERLGQL